MEINIEFILNAIIKIGAAFWHSGFFWWIKFFLAIYVAVLFVDIVLLLVLRGMGEDIKNTLMGAQMPLNSKKKTQKKWLAIEKRLDLNDNNQNKVAILEADKLIDEVLRDIGYVGKNMQERLDAADNNQIEEIDLLLEAHAVRNRIIHEDDFVVDKDEASRVIGLYREFLDGIEII